MTRIGTFLQRVLPWLAATVLAPSLLSAQSAPTRTTLPWAQGAPSAWAGAQCTMSVGRDTGITNSTTSLQSFCLIDQEPEQVVSNSSTPFVVRRTRQGIGTAHVSGATVICGYSGRFDPSTGTVSSVIGSPTVGSSVTGATFLSTLPVGTCTRANQGILPVFFVTSLPTGTGPGNYGYTVDCLGGKWIAGTLPEYPPQHALVLASNIPIGSVAYSSLGTNTTDVNGQEWLTSIYVPHTAPSPA